MPGVPRPTLSERVAWRLRLASSLEAEPIVDRVFAVLATQIREPERALLAERLPERLARVVRRTRPGATLGLAEVHLALAADLEISESRASSLVEATCEALLASMSAYDRDRLCSQLSTPWAEDLERLAARLTACCNTLAPPAQRTPRAARRGKRDGKTSGARPRLSVGRG